MSTWEDYFNAKAKFYDDQVEYLGPKLFDHKLIDKEDHGLYFEYSNQLSSAKRKRDLYHYISSFF